MITNKYTIREKNEALILEKIIMENNISRSDLANETGLNKASVSDIIKELLSKNLIIEDEIGMAGQLGGRKPILLKLNKYAAASISIDIAPKYIEGIICHLDGSIIFESKVRSQEINKENVISYVLEMINTLTSNLEDSTYGIIGISFAIHGLITDNSIVYTPNYTLPHDLFEQLNTLLPYNLFIDNEANLAALGEYTFGNHSRSLVSLNIDMGIGAGIVEEGKLKTGNHGFAGEIGHSILVPFGKKCLCGNHGCLEQYASHRAIYEQLNIQQFYSGQVIDRYKENDSQTIDVLTENAKFLSVAINNLIMIYDPEIIIINSSIYNRLPFLFDIIKENMENNFPKTTKICNSPLNKKATLLGGISKSIQSFLNIQNLKLDR